MMRRLASCATARLFRTAIAFCLPLAPAFALASALAFAPAPGAAAGPDASPAPAPDLSAGSYDFHEVAPASPAQRLRDAPQPDPDTVPHPQETQQDSRTGADTTPFGSAYPLSSPFYGEQEGENGVAGSVGPPMKLPGLGAPLVLLQWGFPRPPMPKVPGDDLRPAPPPVAIIRFAVQADDQPLLDAKARWIVGRAVQAYGRAGLTEIVIEQPAATPRCCVRYPELVRSELIQSGLGPDRLLPGHVIRVVLARMIGKARGEGR